MLRPRTSADLERIKNRLGKRRLLGELNRICAYHHVDPDDVLRGTFTKAVMAARDSFVACLRRTTMLSWAEMGTLLEVDHSNLVRCFNRFKRTNGSAAAQPEDMSRDASPGTPDRDV